MQRLIVPVPPKINPEKHRLLFTSSLSTPQVQPGRFCKPQRISRNANPGQFSNQRSPARVRVWQRLRRRSGKDERNTGLEGGKGNLVTWGEESPWRTFSLVSVDVPLCLSFCKVCKRTTPSRASSSASASYLFLSSSSSSTSTSPLRQPYSPNLRKGQMQSLPRAAGPGSHGGLRRDGAISAHSSLSRGGGRPVVW